MENRNSIFFAATFLIILAIIMMVNACKPVTSGNLVSVEFKSDKYRIEKTKEGTARLVMENFNQIWEPGDPVLPVRFVDVAIPPNTDLNKIRIKYSAAYKELPDKLDIMPAPPYKTSHDKKEFIFWNFKPVRNGRDISIYSTDSFYPSQPVQIILKSQVRKWKFVRIAYYPFQYNPVKKTIRKAESVTAVLDYDTVNLKEGMLHTKVKDWMDREVKERFLNYRDALKWYKIDSIADYLTSDAPGYVIITTNNTVTGLGSVLTDFINSKTNLGYHVSVITETQYGNLTGQPPDKTPEKIRKWLSNNYMSNNIKYALLIGNPDPDDQLDNADNIGDIPMKQCWPMRLFPYNREYPTDYYYANLTGNWDLDNDGYFGETYPSDHAASPDPSIDSTTFSIRWTGKIKAGTNGMYHFYSSSNDGFKLIIDGSTVISNLIPHYVSSDYGDINLTQGLHDIKMEYFNIRKDAFVMLCWQTPDAASYNDLSPDELYHLDNGNYVSGGLTGEYFNNQDFTEPVFTRIDTHIFFFWVTGDRGTNGMDFTPDIYVGRIPVYDNDLNATKAILNKIISYENQNPVPDWRSKVLLPMRPFDDETPGYDLGENIKNDAAIPQGYNYFRIYEENYNLNPPPELTPCNPDNVLNSWKNGYGLVTWMTGGSVTEATSVFSVPLCIQLDDSKPSFNFQCSTYTGMPEANNNLGFSLLKHGAISTVSASRVSFYQSGILPPDASRGNNIDLAYYYSRKLIEGSKNGDAFYRTMSQSNMLMNNMTFNIYGDPELSLSALPDLTVVASNCSISGQDYIINLTVKNIGAMGSGPSLVYIDAIDPTPPAGINEIRIQLVEELPAIARGDEYSFTRKINLAEIHANEIRFIAVQVDPKNSVKESDEYNNMKMWAWDQGL